MQPAVTYNVPRRSGDCVTPEDVVLIVEKDNTHLNDVEYRNLTDAERGSLRAAFNQPALAATIP